MTYYLAGKTGDGWYQMKTENFAIAQTTLAVMTEKNLMVVFSVEPIVVKSGVVLA